MKSVLSLVPIVLEGYVVLFLLLHDWVPLGRLNNIHSKGEAHSLWLRVVGTIIPVALPIVGLAGSLAYCGSIYPRWLVVDLWVGYIFLLIGILEAWWIPYFFREQPKRAEMYRVLFEGTHRFLPERNGITPDTLHVSFHLATVLVLVLLALR